jgi:hypothetical protein
MKHCTACKQEKPLAEFSKERKAADGLRWICKQCDAQKSRATYARRKSEGIVRYQQIERRYGVSKEQYLGMLASQGHRCTICSEALTEPCVDHCHTTGKVRGLLCHHCNKGLGMFKDNPAIIQAAIDYLGKTS